jgi:hypothetical protein
MNEKSHIKNTVQNYLMTETNFALLMAGKWGAGKTYFYENDIVALAKATKVDNSPMAFLPVRISLFGINSIDELESEIVASLYPFLKNSALKMGVGLFKSITKGVLKNKFDVDISDYVPESFGFDKKDVINKEHVLLCFDDLERRGKNLDIRQIIGYINSLVENNGSKVIILTNEDQLGDEDYKSFKEKTIGISILFEQDISLVYDAYIK